MLVLMIAVLRIFEEAKYNYVFRTPPATMDNVGPSGT
jgi:hypothetical protein